MAEQQQQQAPQSASDINMMQKAAMVISAIGSENASRVFKFFSDEEIERLTLEVAKMDYWPVEVVTDVLNDFYEVCLTQKVISEGGVEYAREILEKAFGPQAASSLFDKITKQLKSKSFAFVRKADYKNLLAIVQNEHPQTIALILSYSRSDQASAILAELLHKGGQLLIVHPSHIHEPLAEGVDIFPGQRRRKEACYVVRDDRQITRREIRIHRPHRSGKDRCPGSQKIGHPQREDHIPHVIALVIVDTAAQHNDRHAL